MGGNRHPDGVRADAATAAHLASFESAEHALGRFSAPVLLDESKAEQRLFVASFDGTGNSKRDATKFTNVALIDEQFRSYARDAEDRIGYVPIHAGYVEGPGTQGGVSGMVDAVYGGSYEARIEDMYFQFVSQAKVWLDENPGADIRILATGFSRGAEQAAGFTRLVEERGIQNPTGAIFKRDADGLIIGQVSYPNPPLRAPGTVIQAAALFDPVGTGAPRQNDRRLAESVVSAFQITALDERRNLFQGTLITDPGQTADGRFLNVSVAGAHSDVGGGYRRDGLGVLSGNLAIDYANALIRPPPLEKRALPDDPDRYVIHRSEQHSAIYGTSIFDRNSARAMQDLLRRPRCAGSTAAMQCRAMKRWRRRWTGSASRSDLCMAACRYGTPVWRHPRSRVLCCQPPHARMDMRSRNACASNSRVIRARRGCSRASKRWNGTRVNSRGGAVRTAWRLRIRWICLRFDRFAVPELGRVPGAEILSHRASSVGSGRTPGATASGGATIGGPSCSNARSCSTRGARARNALDPLRGKYRVEHCTTLYSTQHQGRRHEGIQSDRGCSFPVDGQFCVDRGPPPADRSG